MSGGTQIVVLCSLKNKKEIVYFVSFQLVKESLWICEELLWGVIHWIAVLLCAELLFFSFLNPVTDWDSSLQTLVSWLLAVSLFVLHSSRLMWYLVVINLLEYQSALHTSGPTYLIITSREYIQLILRGLGPHTSSHCRARHFMEMLAHSCVAVKMLALHGGMYNVCVWHI